MSRGGGKSRRVRDHGEDHDGPERRCIASGESGPTYGKVRFVLDPDGQLVPDVAERLPGRGVWLSADRASVEKAVKKRLFSRGFKQPVEVAASLVDDLEVLLLRRAVDAVSMCRKAGVALNGFEKVRARLRADPPVGALLAASDGAADGRGKLVPLAGEARIVAVLTADELGMAFGRDSVVHASLDVGGATDRALRELDRLDALRQSG
ncbi:MAG: RNA-binding protein [Pikeienuella sp.]